MWSYYGAKTNIAHLYPKPKHDIVEWFAGTARYSLLHFEREVTLIDKYDVIIKIWKHLQKCSPKDILRLPRAAKQGQTINDFNFDCEEEKLLFGFLIAKALARPQISVSDRVSIMRPNHINYSLQRIAKNLFKIKHWNFILGCYEDVFIEGKKTDFIDPPYEFGVAAYVWSNKKINFINLAEWCKRKQGQTIVCENTRATWMDFKPIISQRGSIRQSTEAIWTNEKTQYDNLQLELF